MKFLFLKQLFTVVRDLNHFSLRRSCLEEIDYPCYGLYWRGNLQYWGCHLSPNLISSIAHVLVTASRITYIIRWLKLSVWAFGKKSVLSPNLLKRYYLSCTILIMLDINTCYFKHQWHQIFSSLLDLLGWNLLVFIDRME